MVMDVIQINISGQIFAMVEGLLPSMQLSEDEKAPIVEKKNEPRRLIREDSDEDPDMDPDALVVVKVRNYFKQKNK